ncbi:MAG: VanZ family protein [Bacteroidetes bacterium]|nr:VanZ family protein [Bacteroidota bacterium]
MHKLILRFKPFFKVFFWIWLIFILVMSSVPKLPDLKLKLDESVIRLDYAIHFVEYFLLVSFFLLWRIKTGMNPTIMIILLTLLIGMATGFADEFHQKIITGRTYNPIDMLSNFLGALTGVVTITLYLKIISHKIHSS